MKARPFLPLVLLAPFLLASRWAGDLPTFHPAASTSLTKHFVQEFETELEDMTMELDGKDVSQAAGQVQIALKVTQKLTVTDLYQAVGDGRPTKLKRTYDEIAGNTHLSQSVEVMQSSDQEHDMPMASELEGSTVVFTWDEGDASYDAAFDGDEGDAALLEDLEEDLDLRGLLPTTEVAKGDTWKLPAAAVKAALHPGGDVKLHPESQGEAMTGTDMSPAEMIGDPQGDFTATYQGTREEDGVRIAVIKLELDLKSAQDMSGKLQDMKEKMKEKLPPGLDADVRAFDTEIELRGEGELLWNLETGLVHGLHVSGEVRTIVDVSVDLAMGDKAQTMEQSLTFAGTHTLTLTTGE